MAEAQLSLNLDIKHDASLSDFAGPGWMSIIDAVRQLHVGLIGQLYLFGSPETGKSHLYRPFVSRLLRWINQRFVCH